jgi:hypothetical protein
VDHTITSDPILESMNNCGFAVDNNLVTADDWARVLGLFTFTIAVVRVLAVVTVIAVLMVLSVLVWVVVGVIGVLVRKVVIGPAKSTGGSSRVTQTKQLAELEGLD